MCSRYNISVRTIQCRLELFRVESSVLLSDNLTEFFLIEVRVIKVVPYPLSCLSYLFINDLIEELINMPKVQDASRKLSNLLFADDLVLIAETKAELELLNVICEWSIKWRCKFNCDKCAAIVYSYAREM